jgi:hypothetical protein
MPIWLILAVLASLGATALLTAVLYRINRPDAELARTDQPADSAGE